MCDQESEGDRPTERLETVDFTGRDGTASFTLKLSESGKSARLGRYEVMRSLGSGGFGTVLLARDTQLDRLVAIKIPNAKRFKDPATVDSLLSEAKMAASLRHDAIVTVFDVGWQESVPFIVLEYIHGTTLSEFINKEDWSNEFAARIMMEIALGLNHAHNEGFIHRDLKPQNILLDNEDRPRISDFGLAVRHRDLASYTDEIVGTPMYMAPEQAAGENHRIDQRTDIWALGVIFYQLLCRKRPFPRGQYQDVIARIIRAEYSPPSSVDPSVPGELERICMRCMSRSMSQRYRHADELARDLTLWLKQSGDLSGSDFSSGSHLHPPGVAHGSEEAVVVTRGLRPFRAEDKGFFSRLLPGPHDRNGLPLTLSFWISALRQRNPESAFDVGLLYGPSGCGKSSFVRAGVMPFLDRAVTSMYVDATADGLEERLIKQVKSRLDGFDSVDDLPQLLEEVRERFSTSEEKTSERPKLILFLDQFEQWLAKNQPDPEHPVVQALRQCDGGSVQCVLIVRDDFWLSISRFMALLEVSIVEGDNAMLIDSFDVEHAKRVLTELGKSMSCLPTSEADMTESQRRFINRAVDELSDQGQLFPVQLAIFSELVRKQPWNEETLNRLGGARGVGDAYLENTVGRKASAARRVHSEAARRVLSELLPPRGDIKKSSVQREQLLQVSGYADSPRDFDALLRLLDTELRVLTPVRASDSDDTDSVSSKSLDQEVAAYRLTHDFLVPSIRQWLERDLRGKRGGRQQLLLQEQSSMWADRRSSRYLPSFSEYFLLRLYTRKNAWTKIQTEMMQAAGARIGRRVAAFLIALIAIGTVGSLVYRQGVQRRDAEDAQQLLSSLREVSIDDVPTVLDKLAPLSQYMLSPAREVFHDEQQRVPDRLRAGLAWLRFESDPLEQIVQWATLGNTRPQDLSTITRELQSHRQAAIALLQSNLRDQQLNQLARLRSAVMLVQLDPGDPLLVSMKDELVATLLQQSYTDAESWLSMLEPIQDSLRQPLRASFTKELDDAAARIAMAGLDRFTPNSADLVNELLPSANGSQFRAIVAHYRDRLPELNEWIREDAPSPPEWSAESTERRVATCNYAIARMVCGDARTFIDLCEDRNSTLRALLIEMTNPQRIDLWQLLDFAEVQSENLSVLGALVLASDAFRARPVSAGQRKQLLRLFSNAHRTSVDAELHVAAGLMQKRWRFPKEPASQIENELDVDATAADRKWIADSIGREYVILDVPENDKHPRYRVAISVNEVTVANVREFEKTVRTRTRMIGSGDRPASSVQVGFMAAYCNWWSLQEDFSNQQLCYQSDGSSASVISAIPKDDFLKRDGYRLPTTEEWTIAAGGFRPHWLSKSSAPVAEKYVWNRFSANLSTQPVGGRLPNPQGLIDLYGNVAEVCLDLRKMRSGDAGIYCTLGGSALSREMKYESQESRKSTTPRLLDSYTGFRLTRTLETLD